MSFKNIAFLVFTFFISACGSTNIKHDDSSTSSLPLVAKGEILYEQEAMNLDKSEVAFIYVKDKFTTVRAINDKKVSVPFFGKESRKFVTMPGPVSITFDYGIGDIDGLPTYKANLEAGKSYVLLADGNQPEDVIYFGLYDIKSKKSVGGF